jgi:hypothetical protein
MRNFEIFRLQLAHQWGVPEYHIIIGTEICGDISLFIDAVFIK